ncbi:MAG: flagellar basal body P-ring formation chaperone FlgA [Planctomycetota bacterium]|jgi:flagella basal body P-ring formation protein FlgA
MNTKTVSIVVIACLLASAQFCRASANNKINGQREDSGLHVYLPREVTIKDDAIKLGQVSIIRGEELLVAKAGEIALGRVSVPGQEIIVDRALVLSRLACNGISKSQVTLTGAEEITVRQQQRIIKGSEFVEIASSFLEENRPANSVCRWDPLRVPKDLVVPGVSKDIKLFPRLTRSGARSQARIRIVVLADGREAGVREVAFRLKYNHRIVVTLVELGSGSVITPENVKIEKRISNYPEPADWSPPYGFVTKSRLQANTMIRPGMVGPAERAIIVERNQTVVIRVKRPGLFVTAIGKAKQKARAGEFIKVQNVDSQRIILARVNEDGTVEPIF